MEILQSLNQNALLVNDGKKECIVIGKGIGFGKKKGDVIIPTPGSKFYQVKNNGDDLMENIDEKAFVVAEDITSYAESKLEVSFSGNFIVALASHIQFIEDKYRAVSEMSEPFHYELKYLYPKEYEVAQWALQYLQKKYNLTLPEAEISFLTLHFVSGSVEERGIKNVVELSDVLNALVEIVESNLDKPLNRDTIEFSRFIVHLRYFIIRYFSSENRKEKEVEEELDRLHEISFEMYPSEKMIVEEIKYFLKKEYDVTFGKAEDFYLLLHLVRVIKY